MIPGVVAAANGIVIPDVTWDPSHKASQITLSGGNLVAAGVSLGGWASVLATVGRSSGKRYFELHIDSGSADVMIGVAKDQPTTNHFPGDQSTSYGYYASSGVKYNNNAGTAFGESYTTGAVIGVAMDITGGKIWWSKNGTYQASGDPGAGSSPAFTGIGAGTYYPAFGEHSGATVTARFKSADLSYSPPSGFLPWG